jgi:hypothetical protein
MNHNAASTTTTHSPPTHDTHSANLKNPIPQTERTHKGPNDGLASFGPIGMFVCLLLSFLLLTHLISFLVSCCYHSPLHVPPHRRCEPLLAGWEWVLFLADATTTAANEDWQHPRKWPPTTMAPPPAPAPTPTPTPCHRTTTPPTSHCS